MIIKEIEQKVQKLIDKNLLSPTFDIKTIYEVCEGKILTAGKDVNDNVVMWDTKGQAYISTDSSEKNIYLFYNEDAELEFYEAPAFTRTKLLDITF